MAPTEPHNTIAIDLQQGAFMLDTGDGGREWGENIGGESLEREH